MVAGLIAAALVAATVTLWVTAGKSTETGPGFTCTVAGPSSDPGYCTRAAEHSLRRRVLTPEQAKAAEARYPSVQRAMSSRPCISTRTFTCAPDRRLPQASDAAARLRALNEAGFVNSTVRIARSDDPAPAGSLLYAVPVTDESCLVGYVLEVPGGGGGSTIGGVLPNGRCVDE